MGTTTSQEPSQAPISEGNGRPGNIERPSCPLGHTSGDGIALDHSSAKGSTRVDTIHAEEILVSTRRRLTNRRSTLKADVGHQPSFPNFLAAKSQIGSYGLYDTCILFAVCLLWMYQHLKWITLKCFLPHIELTGVVELCHSVLVSDLGLTLLSFLSYDTTEFYVGNAYDWRCGAMSQCSCQWLRSYTTVFSLIWYYRILRG
jgi:hypothetical protein